MGGSRALPAPLHVTARLLLLAVADLSVRWLCFCFQMSSFGWELEPEGGPEVSFDLCGLIKGTQECRFLPRKAADCGREGSERGRVLHGGV